MASHYSEMDFLFSNITNRENINSLVNNVDNKYNIFDTDGTKYVVYKSKDGSGSGTNNIKRYLGNNVYKNENKSTNPYIQLIMDFDKTQGNPGAGLRLKAADIVYLRDLGVYPINRMAILRRFPEGCFVPEDLNEMNIEPISTVIGWVKPDQNFGKVEFNENWGVTTKRFDQLLSDIVKNVTGTAGSLVPVPDFAQGMLFELYKKADLLERSGVDESVDETYENFDTSNLLSTKTSENNTKGETSTNTWGINNIPIGDPNVLHQGPYRDPEGQNIMSNFQFDLETTYEQKLLGEVDPGSAMLDILDNIYAMGTSNMKFYWGDNSPAIRKARTAASDKGNNLNAWWDMVAQVLTDFWKIISDFFKSTFNKLKENFEKATEQDAKTETANQDKIKKEQELQTSIDNEKDVDKKKKLQDKLSELKAEGVNSKKQSLLDAGKKKFDDAADYLAPYLQSILTSTISIWRFQLRGSIELMVGGKMSSTPWYLTLGNPYAPWLSTNHIIVKSASVETSNEMGFNDQPQRLTAKFNCQFSRALGKQELMRMQNNTFRRTYSSPPPGTESVKSIKAINSRDTENIQNEPLATRGSASVSNQNSGLMGVKTPTSSNKNNSNIDPDFFSAEESKRYSEMQAFRESNPSGIYRIPNK